MADGTDNFDALADALYGGDVRATDVKLVPGTDPVHGREELAAALMGSMERMGLVLDGRLVDPIRAK